MYIKGEAQTQNDYGLVNPIMAWFHPAIKVRPISQLISSLLGPRLPSWLNRWCTNQCSFLGCGTLVVRGPTSRKVLILGYRCAKGFLAKVPTSQ